MAYEKSEHFLLESIKENEISIYQAAKEFGTAYATIEKVIKQYELPTVKRLVRMNRSGIVCDREMLRSALDQEGYLVPKFTRSVTAFGKLVGHGFHPRLYKKLASGDNLPLYKFGGDGSKSIGLNPQRQLEALEFLHQYKITSGARFGQQLLDDETYTRVREQLLREQAELDAEEKERSAREAKTKTAENPEIDVKKSSADENRETSPRAEISPSVGYGALRFSLPENISKKD